MVFLNVIPMIIYNLFSLFFEPIFWVVILIIWFQYRRMAKMKSEFFHIPTESVFMHTMIASFFGIMGGILGSFVLVLVGISVMEIGIQYLWVLAIILMLFNQRFMCFAYAGGIISIVKYFWGIPVSISIPQIMGLVAVLHLVESLLILFSGHLGANPVYLKTKEGQLVGGFNMQKFWPLPIVAMVAAVVPETSYISGMLNMPDWWPLIKSELLKNNENVLYVLVPVIAGLGYGDIALTGKPWEKTNRSATHLFLYSIILLFLAVLSSYFPALSILAAVFSPLGHELVIYYGNKQEFSGKPKFIKPEKGVMILDTLPDSTARKAGIKPGDIILSLNGRELFYNYDLNIILPEVGEILEIEYLDDVEKNIRRKIIKNESTLPMLGLIVVPEQYGYPYLNFSSGGSFFKRLFKRIFKKKSL